MDDAAGVRVVEVEAVHQDAVEQRRVPRRQAQRQADHGHLARPAQAGNGRRGLVGEIVAAGGKRDAGGIEHQVLGALAHLAGDRGRRQVMGEARQRLGDQLRLCSACPLAGIAHFVSTRCAGITFMAEPPRMPSRRSD